MAVSTKSDWLFCATINAPRLAFSHDPYCFGQFEFTRREDPFSVCEKALEESAAHHAVNIRHDVLRLRTYFLNVSQNEAVRSGKLAAHETLTLFRISHFMLTELPLLPAGYLFDLKLGIAQPLLPSSLAFLANSGVAILDEIARHPSQITNMLLSLPPEHYGELGSALRRSTHWSSLAKSMFDHAEILLNYWMACETLTRVTESEILTPKLVTASGFPSSRYMQKLPVMEKTALQKISDYQIWKKRINRLFDDLRNARNDIAHSGYREMELGQHFSDYEILILRRIMPMTVSTLQQLALSALALNHTTVKAMWDSYSQCVLLNQETPLAVRTQGTVIHRLSDPEGPMDF